MDYENMFVKLWDLVLNIARYMTKLWEWITTDIHIGTIRLLGFEVIKGFSFNLLDIAGGVLITLLIMALIKTFVPVA